MTRKSVTDRYQPPAGFGGRYDYPRVGIMSAERPRRRGGKSRFSSWLTSFSGILASLATIVAATSSLFAAHQTSRVNDLTIIVAQQRAKLQQAASSTPARSGASGGASFGGGTYLSALQPTVDNDGLQTGSQTIAAKPYQDSVTFGCDGPAGGNAPDEAFDIAGHTLFRAVVGIPDNAQDATSLDETVTFANQNGTALIGPVVVSLGNPAFVRIAISKVTQLAVTCSGTDSHTQQQDDDNLLTLANAYVTK